MKRTSAYWQSQVFMLFANDPKEERGDTEVFAKQLQEMTDVPEPERGASPSARTIREMRVRYRELSDAGRAAYRLVDWPDSFGLGLLPWEAQQATLELALQMRNRPHPRRPTVREALWYWRLTLGAGSASKEHRFEFACALAFMESTGRTGTGMHRYIEEWLTYRPWEKSEEHHKAWARMHAGDPDFPTGPFQIGWDREIAGGKWRAIRGSKLWLDVFASGGE